MFLLVHIVAVAQVPGTWNEHFSFCNVQQLESVDDNVFALAENGIFIYNTTTEEIQKITKLNGLSTIGLTCFAFCDSTSSFLIGYSDGTLDILYYPSLRVKSIPTIAQKSLYASKKINKIVMHNDTAIIAAEFGVLTFSMTTKNFISTTILSNDGSYVPAKSVACGNDRIYSATTKGIYSASLDNPNLSDYTTWTKLTAIPYENDTISHIAVLNDVVYYVHNETGALAKDSIFKYDNGIVEVFKLPIHEISNLKTKNNTLYVAATHVAKVYDSAEKLLFSIDSSTTKKTYFNDVTSTTADYWCASRNFGIVSTTKNIVPMGPKTNTIADMQFANDYLHVVEGHPEIWMYGIYERKDNVNNWVGHTNYEVNRSVSVEAIPNTPRFYYGTVGGGIVESESFMNYIAIYDNTNTIMTSSHTTEDFTYIADITSDKKSNLWFVNQGVEKPIIVLDKDKNWYSFTIDKGTRSNTFNKIIVDSRGYKWLTGTNKVVVFFENNTFSDTTDDKTVQISLSDSEGMIASFSTCVAEDLDGEIWIGTNQGIAIHSAPSRVFKDRQSISRIKIEIDGEVGYLLSSENITCIAVDGANRKWIGTENSGVFLISENGTEQLENFTKSNSPLPTNMISSIAINYETGEVYIGTSNGLVSFVGDATVGKTEMSEIQIYPNPVRETYEGNIIIKGLVADANVKITDISGNLVRTIIANGGTATWDGRNLYGERVQTGIYLVYISDETATYTTIKKILFIN